MSASHYGASLLLEVQEESLKHLFSDLRQLIQPHTNRLTGLLELDRLIEGSQPGTSTLPQQSTSNDHNDEDDNVQDTSIVTFRTTASTSRSLKDIKSPIIEITSSTSKAGKTSLLYLLTAIAILPQKYNGNESAVVWLDTDSSFSASRLYQICLHQLVKAEPILDGPNAQLICKEALKHVHIFPIQSSKQLLQILVSLPAYLLQLEVTPGNERKGNLPEHYSLHRSLSLLILDSAQSFYHIDRFDSDIARLESIGKPSISPIPDTTLITNQTLNHLKSVQTQFECSILYTTFRTTSVATTNPHPYHPTPSNNTTTTVLQSTTNPNPNLNPNRPNINPETFSSSSSTTTITPWTTHATLSLTLSRLPTPQFPPHMTISECLLDQNNRMDVVRKGRMRVDVNDVWLRRVVRDGGVREGLGGGGVGWVFEVGGGEVVVGR